jgi:uncharacterized lipoprotein NlpE involved in copper resistance
MIKKLATSALLAVLALAGCQQKSDIDKCVEAQAITLCNRLIGAEPLYKLQQASESKCAQESIKANGGEWQLQCLKAQSGK